mmetsp:Transcript_50507/g.163472  ORF Transcript_50507/g.163472 Transcript_50507/m.163472 type:complete len:327 (-) Transcript_50507:724-1704(-)
MRRARPTTSMCASDMRSKPEASRTTTTFFTNSNVSCNFDLSKDFNASQGISGTESTNTTSVKKAPTWPSKKPGPKPAVFGRSSSTSNSKSSTEESTKMSPGAGESLRKGAPASALPPKAASSSGSTSGEAWRCAGATSALPPLRRAAPRGWPALSNATAACCVSRCDGVDGASTCSACNWRCIAKLCAASRSDWYVSSSVGGAPCSTTNASFHAKFEASSTPRLPPAPPKGLKTAKASPQRNKRPCLEAAHIGPMRNCCATQLSTWHLLAARSPSTALARSLALSSFATFVRSIPTGIKASIRTNPFGCKCCDTASQCTPPTAEEP